MTPTEWELDPSPRQCPYSRVGFCTDACLDDRDHPAMSVAEAGSPFAADRIVRALSTLRCWEYDSYDGTYQCQFCSHFSDAVFPFTDPPQMVNDTHDDYCLYALALAYVEANPE